MSTSNMSTTVEELLKSFDLLPDTDRHQVATEILRRTYASLNELDEAQMSALYAEFAEADRKLAEEGIEEYGRGLVSEDAE